MPWFGAADSNVITIQKIGETRILGVFTQWETFIIGELDLFSKLVSFWDMKPLFSQLVH